MAKRRRLSRAQGIQTAGAASTRIDAKQSHPAFHAPEMRESAVLAQIEERHATWEKRMPEESCRLRAFIVGLDDAERTELLAHCISIALDPVYDPKSRGADNLQRNADDLASPPSLDITAYWQPTAKGYLSRIPKTRILEAVREAVSKEAAENLASLKKQALAEAAEQRLSGKGWLPELRVVVG